MDIALVTDAWHPQINGVVQTWTYMIRELTALGHTVRVVTPDGARTIAAPSEPGLRLAVNARRHVAQALGERAPDALHIATEGPLGWAARRHALKRGWRFTTSYHTRFPEYLAHRFRIPAALTYAVMRRFHAPSQRVLVPTRAMHDELQAAGFERLQVWARGVDGERFQPAAVPAQGSALPYPRPIWLNIGRVAPEKGLRAFLALDLPGTKVVVGDGAALPRLRARFPEVVWLGAQPHADLGKYYADADVFVFPSRTDTFGLVMLEANACGTPVAAFPVTGPINVVKPGLTGVLSEDLGDACRRALQLDRAQVRAAALPYTWRAIADDLLGVLVPTVGQPDAAPSARVGLAAGR